MICKISTINAMKYLDGPTATGNMSDTFYLDLDATHKNIIAYSNYNLSNSDISKVHKLYNNISKYCDVLTIEIHKDFYSNNREVSANGRLIGAPLNRWCIIFPSNYANRAITMLDRKEILKEIIKTFRLNLKIKE